MLTDVILVLITARISKMNILVTYAKRTIIGMKTHAHKVVRQDFGKTHKQENVNNAHKSVLSAQP